MHTKHTSLYLLFFLLSLYLSFSSLFSFFLRLFVFYLFSGSAGVGARYAEDSVDEGESNEMFMRKMVLDSDLHELIGIRSHGSSRLCILFLRCVLLCQVRRCALSKDDSFTFVSQAFAGEPGLTYITTPSPASCRYHVCVNLAPVCSQQCRSSQKIDSSMPNFDIAVFIYCLFFSSLLVARTLRLPSSLDRPRRARSLTTFSNNPEHNAQADRARRRKTFHSTYTNVPFRRNRADYDENKVAWQKDSCSVHEQGVGSTLRSP